MKNISNYDQIKNDCWIMTPLIMGCMTKEMVSFPGKKLESVFTVLCRKQVNRLGARYYSRGIDKEGNVSNFVESEQIFTIWPKGNILKNIQ